MDFLSQDNTHHEGWPAIEESTVEVELQLKISPGKDLNGEIFSAL